VAVLSDGDGLGSVDDDVEEFSGDGVGLLLPDDDDVGAGVPLSLVLGVADDDVPAVAVELVVDPLGDVLPPGVTSSGSTIARICFS